MAVSDKRSVTCVHEPNTVKNPVIYVTPTCLYVEGLAPLVLPPALGYALCRALEELAPLNGRLRSGRVLAALREALQDQYAQLEERGVLTYIIVASDMGLPEFIWQLPHDGPDDDGGHAMTRSLTRGPPEGGLLCWYGR